MNTVSLSSGWRYRAVILSVVFSAGGYIAFSVWGGWTGVVAAIGEVSVGGMLLVLSMSLLNYGLRFMRWQRYLHLLGYPVPWLPSLTIYLAGFALTTTPGKAGEALRGVLLRVWQVPYPKSFAAFLSERLSDLLAVVLLTLLGLNAYPQAKPLVFIGLGLVAVGLLVLSQQRMLDVAVRFCAERRSRLTRGVGALFEVLITARLCHKPRTLIIATSLSLLAWSAEAVAFHWILQWMGADISLSFAMFVYALSMLAGAISFMPGGLGGAEAVMVGLLILKGMPASGAIAATVLIRLATLWFAVGLGAGALLKAQNSLRHTQVL